MLRLVWQQQQLRQQLPQHGQGTASGEAGPKGHGKGSQAGAAAVQVHADCGEGRGSDEQQPLLLARQPAGYLPGLVAGHRAAQGPVGESWQEGAGARGGGGSRCRHGQQEELQQLVVSVLGADFFDEDVQIPGAESIAGSTGSSSRHSSSSDSLLLTAAERSCMHSLAKAGSASCSATGHPRAHPRAHPSLHPSWQPQHHPQHSACCAGEDTAGPLAEATEGGSSRARPAALPPRTGTTASAAAAPVKHHSTPTAVTKPPAAAPHPQGATGRQQAWQDGKHAVPHSSSGAPAPLWLGAQQAQLAMIGLQVQERLGHMFCDNKGTSPWAASFKCAELLHRLLGALLVGLMAGGAAVRQQG